MYKWKEGLQWARHGPVAQGQVRYAVDEQLQARVAINAVRSHHRRKVGPLVSEL